MITKKANIYDCLIIAIISFGCFGELLSPITVQRIFAIFLTPWVIINYIKSNKNIPLIVSVFFFIWLSSSVLSLVWSIDKSNGLKYLIYNFCSIINFLAIILLSYKAKSPIKSIILGWILLFVSTTPIALWEILTKNHLYMSVQNSNSAIYNSDGIKVARIFASVTYGNLNNYVVTILYCFPFIVLGIDIFHKRRFFIWIILGLLLFILLINSSRGGLFCVGIGLIITYYYFFKYSVISKKVLFSISLIFIALIIANASFLFNQIAGRLIEKSITEDSTRMEIYQRGFDIISNTYFFGCGIGCLEKSLDILGHGKISAMHNAYFEFLSEYGLISFVFFIILQFNVIKKLANSKILKFKFLGIMILCMIIPLSIINSGYLESSIYWIFWASLLSLPLFNRRFNAKLIK